ncbi:MAG: hypothetical protein E7588_05710 [Ruminococcaceae bacterium]|nr:hypothetical protein [Oscillospiraceae bacterium]
MKQYLIKSMDKKDFSKANTAEICNFQWMDNGYEPKTQAWVVFVAGEGFHVRLRSYEKNPKATYKNYMDHVCEDACMEFFFNFKPENGDTYINFEANPLGTLNSSVGEGRHGRRPVKEWWGTLPEITATVEEDYWQLEYCLDLERLEKVFGKINTEKGAKYRGNFYKCGDETDFEHYGIWNPVNREKPDYHCPDQFGELVMD